MAITYSEATNNDRLDVVNTRIGTSGLLRIYDGTKPATVDTALAGNTLLAELALSATAAASATSATLTLNAVTSDPSANASGIPTWATLTTSAGVRVSDFTAGVGSGDLNMDDDITATGIVAFTSGVISA